MNAFCSRRSRAGILVPAFLLLISSLVIPVEPVMAQSGCPVTPTYDTTPSPLTGVINSYYPGREDLASAGEQNIDIGPRTGATAVLAAGNLALVIQMQDADIDNSNDDSYGDGDNDTPARGHTALNSTGLYEYIRVTSVTGTAPNEVVNFIGTGAGNGLRFTYRAGAYVSGGGGNGQRSYQVIRVPQYLNATVAAGLTAKEWSGPVVSIGTGGNGPTGGVLVFDVSGTLTLASQTISVDGLGFRGGGGRALGGEDSVNPEGEYRTSSSDPVNGSKGEGIAGTPRYVWNAAGGALLDNNSGNGYPQGSYARGAPGNAGGGGTDGNRDTNANNTGGGGGGNCGTGGKGGNAFSEPTNDYGGWGGIGTTGTATLIFMGGGGGAGATNNGSQDNGMNAIPPDGDGRFSSGGAGGGIILVRAYTMSGTGTFTANGANAPFDAGRDGGGGGGAGGTIGLTFRFADRNNITARANGGNGGDAWPSIVNHPTERHGGGGGGGGGFVLTSGSIGTTQVTGGANGVTTTSNDDYGATDGSSGCSITTYVFTSVPGVSGGGECLNVASVEMVKVDARLYEAGALLSWTTASESDNLGFNIYRNRDGVRERINPGLVAGAALKTTATMRAGHSYVWWDGDATPSSQYWIEDVGFRGTGTMYGPYFPYAVSGGSPIATRSATLASKRSADAPPTSPIIWADGLENAPIANAKGGGSTGAPPTTPVATQWAIAGRPALKLAVSNVGWYRVGFADFASAGIDPSQYDPRTIKLYADGIQIPIQVSGEADGRFDATDAVEFFGSGVDLPSTDTRVYYLTAGDGLGLRMKVVPHVAGPLVRASFASTVELKNRTIHFSALSNGEKENIFGDILGFGPLDQVLSLPHVDPAGSSAKVEVALQGVTLVPHRVKVEVNGTTVGEMAFADKQNPTGVFSVPASLLTSGDNTITLTPDAATYDISLVDVVRVTYSRLPLSDGTPIAASVPAGRQVLGFGGFASPGIRVVDATNAVAPQEILGVVGQDSNGFGIAFRQPATTSRLLAFTPDQMRRPDSIILNAASSWNQSRQNYDVVFLTTSEFAPALAPLVALRQSQGHRVAVVDIEDVFDEFGFGYRSPAAVRAFIDRARTTWTPGLTHVLIAGDASLDPRNYFGLGGHFVPTKSIETFTMETFSDDWMADGNGDDVPDVAIGRLPVINVAELETVVSKILAYEAQPAAPRSVLSVSDSNDTYEFGDATNRMSGIVPVPSVINSVHRSEIGDAAARASILDSFATGTDLVVFAGHGSVTFWRGGLLTSEDVMEISSPGRLSVSVLANCLNGYFGAPGLRSVGEALVLAPGGGSVVSWTSAGVSDSGWQELMISEFLRVAYQPGMTTGNAARAAKASVNGDVRKTWVLLGDPMVKLK